MLYGSFQMDHRALYCKLKGVQCESGSQPTIHILITSCQCFIIPPCLYLNIFKSSDFTKVLNNLVGCSADTVQTPPRNIVWHHLCLPAEWEAQREVSGLDWTPKGYITYGHTSKSHLQGEMKFSVTCSVSHLTTIPCNCLEFKYVFPEVPGKRYTEESRARIKDLISCTFW